MTDYSKEFDRLIQDVFSALGKGIDRARYEIVVRDTTHSIPKLPDGKLGVYTFL